MQENVFNVNAIPPVQRDTTFSDTDIVKFNGGSLHNNDCDVSGNIGTYSLVISLFFDMRNGFAFDKNYCPTSHVRLSVCPSAWLSPSVVAI